MKWHILISLFGFIDKEVYKFYVEKKKRRKKKPSDLGIINLNFKFQLNRCHFQIPKTMRVWQKSHNHHHQPSSTIVGTSIATTLPLLSPSLNHKHRHHHSHLSTSTATTTLRTSTTTTTSFTLVVVTTITTITTTTTTTTYLHIDTSIKISIKFRFKIPLCLIGYPNKNFMKPRASNPIFLNFFSTLIPPHTNVP